MAAFNSPAGGGGSSIQAAMSRRGLSGGSPIQTQQGPMAPGFDPNTAQQPPVAPQQGLPAPTGGQVPAQAPQQPAQPQATAMGLQTGESTLIIKALDARLKSLSERGL